MKTPSPNADAASVTTADAGTGQQTSPFVTQTAGLVLLAPYMPRLLERLGLLHENGFVSFDATHRAVNLLYFVARGQVATDQTDLTLQKILCGLPPQRDIPLGFVPTVQEAETVKAMQDAVISQFAVIGHINSASLQSTFLTRPGAIKRLPTQAYEMVVEHATYDILLDRLPWSYRVLHFPWMKSPLHVSWR